MKKILLTASALAVLFSAPVFAQTTPAAPAPTPPAAAAPPSAQPAAPMNNTRAKPATASEKRAKSADCSKQADAQGLHGKKRHQFREACKKNMT
ncbi:phosphate starvation-inducible protein PsiF [Methylocella sp. CPCC 101449]|uniref:phosphate starvation-inducible protein PsiF n=1 Tax=Methylocella sp. CPCC 101449 TaxID=2987531 RepID=UPI002890D7E7|nr:phosphate starvation-inducible protein PsiF [Methylocella sp. CPCC 101449]MDT2021829.1 phosphate starvation-inducible protein PsiF [Methylocella sp. CPCC 101449]